MNVRSILHELVGHFKPFFPQQQYQANPEKKHQMSGSQGD